MDTDDEVRERQELQRRAYGPRGAALTAEEEARLRLLQSVAGGPAGRMPLVVAAPEGGATGDGALGNGTPGASGEPGGFAAWSMGGREDTPDEDPAHEDPAHEGPATDDVAAESEPPSSRPPSRPSSRWVAPGWPRPRVLGIAVIALLAVGTLIGVSIPRPPDFSLPLTSEQEQRRDELFREFEEIDPGSIALLAVEGEAQLWLGTRNNGALLCGMLDVEGQDVRSACSKAEEEKNWVLHIQDDIPDTERSGKSYSAQVITTGAGIPVGMLQGYEWREDPWQYVGLTAAERQTAERLMTEYGAYRPQIVGYFGAAPVWFLTSSSAPSFSFPSSSASGGEGESCLVVETKTDGDVRSCIPTAPPQEVTVSTGSTVQTVEMEPEQRIALALLGEGGRDAAQLELRFKDGHSPYLTITVGEPPPFWGARIE